MTLCVYEWQEPFTVERVAVLTREEREGGEKAEREGEEERKGGKVGRES